MSVKIVQERRVTLPVLGYWVPGPGSPRQAVPGSFELLFACGEDYLAACRADARRWGG